MKDSHNAKRKFALQALKAANRSGKPIKGRFERIVKGGYNVEINGVDDWFLPDSRVILDKETKPNDLLKQEEDFLVLIDAKGHVTLDRTQLQEREANDMSKIKFKPGNVVRGTVVHIAESEDTVFFKIGEMLCRMHRRDVSWLSFKTLAEKLPVDWVLKVKILRIGREMQLIHVGRKQLEDEPSKLIHRDYPVGTIDFGTVIDAKEDGVVVEMEAGIYGFVHRSEMEWRTNEVKPEQFPKLDKKIKVKVLRIGKKSDPLLLSMKRCTPNPWEKLAAEHSNGDVLTGKIVQKDAEGISVALSYGLEGHVKKSDLSYAENSTEVLKKLHIGDEVAVVLLDFNEKKGRISLGIKQLTDEAFNEYTNANPKRSLVTGEVIHVDERTARVQLAQNVIATLPAREAKTEKVRDLSEFIKVGDKVEAMIINIDADKHHILLSLKAKERAATNEGLRELRQRNKKIANDTTSFGEMVKQTLGNQSHSEQDRPPPMAAPASEAPIVAAEQSSQDDSDASAETNKNMRERGLVRNDMTKITFAEGEVVKHIQPDPLEQIINTYPPGSRVFGRVTAVKEYGAFVEIESGIGGLVHRSQMDWRTKSVNPKQILSPEDEVEVMVLNIDMNNRRISLGIKQCTPNPWEDFAAAYRKRAELSGKIDSKVDFGIFVALPEGLNGLVHISDLSYTESGADVLKEMQVGTHVDVVLLKVDVAKQRISLGIKQLAHEEFDKYISANPKRSLVTGEVIHVDERTARVQLAQNVIATLPAREAKTEKVRDLSEFIKVGDKVEAVIININADKHRISLSLKAKDRAATKKSIRELRQRKRNKDDTTSFGEMVKQILSSQSDSEQDKPALPPAAPATEVPLVAAEQSSQDDSDASAETNKYMRERREQAWNAVKQAFESGEPIEGLIQGVASRQRGMKLGIKDGFSVIINGVHCFLPDSLADIIPIPDEYSFSSLDGNSPRDKLFGKVERFLVRRIHPRFGPILDRKKLLERELFGNDMTKITVVVGDVVKSKVVAIAGYPENVAFVKIDEKFHGRLHFRNLSCSPTNEIDEILTVGREIEVEILRIDRATQRIHVGVKQSMQPDPLVELINNYTLYERVSGRVTAVKEYGAFVEMANGIEGLVPKSEMNPKQVLIPGDEVEVTVQDIDYMSRSVTLGKCTLIPWVHFAKTYRKGDKLRGKVLLIYGSRVRIELSGSKSDLVYQLSLSSDKDASAKVLKELNEGTEFDAMLHDIDEEQRFITLDIKQLVEENIKTHKDLGKDISRRVIQLDSSTSSLVKGEIAAVGERPVATRRVAESLDEMTDQTLGNQRTDDGD